MDLDNDVDIVESGGMNVVAMGKADAAVSAVDESPDVSGYVIEDDTPVDNVRSEKQQRLLTESLHSAGYAPPSPEDGPVRPFIVTANVGLFVFQGESPLVPDVMLSADVQQGKDLRLKKNRTYFAWILGKVPDVVIEVVSNTEGDELGSKRRRYARMKIPHYVVWDPDAYLSDEPLQVFELRGDLLVPVNTRYFPTVGLGICSWQGVYEECDDVWLRWCTADGTVVPTGAELAAKESARAGAAETQLKAAQDRVNAERERAERLAEKLRALGVTVD